MDTGITKFVLELFRVQQKDTGGAYVPDTMSLQAAYDDRVLILAAVGSPATQLRTSQSGADTAEVDQFATFLIGLVDVDTGELVVGDIDITGIPVNTLERSRGGGAFSAAGITQPTWAKATGQVSTSPQFITAEWAVGDTAKLTLSGIDVTIGGGTGYVPAKVWLVHIVDDTGIQTTVEDTNTKVTSLIAGGYLGQLKAHSLNLVVSADAGDTTLATASGGDCMVEAIIVMAKDATIHANMTNIEVSIGPTKKTVVINAMQGARANLLNAGDQITTIGPWLIKSGDLVVTTNNGAGVGNVDLDYVIKYRPLANGAALG